MVFSAKTEVGIIEMSIMTANIVAMNLFMISLLSN